MEDFDAMMPVSGDDVSKEPPKYGLRRGFTLVEIAVVFVIIGLIVGGVLVGRDLITTAGLRATIGQVESYSAAVNAFRDKYGGLPGDLERTEAEAFGLFTFDDGLNLGNDNGVLDLANPANYDGQFSGESPAYWRHLSEAGLISGAYGSLGNSSINISTGFLAGDVVEIDASIPPARIGRGNYITAYSDSGINYLEINGISHISQLGEYTVQTPALLPSEAAALDTKLDDGLGNTGSVVGRGGFNITGALNRAPTGMECLDFTANEAHVYLLGSQTTSCGLRIQLSR